MFGFGKKPKRKPSTPRQPKQAKALAEAELENRLKDAEIESLKNRITILEETINVLRDCLGAHQITANVHSAEGKILLNDLQQKQGPLFNGRG